MPFRTRSAPLQVRLSMIHRCILLLLVLLLLTSLLMVSTLTAANDNTEMFNAPPGAPMMKTTNKSEIKTIAILGERNSGTTWMLKEIQRCYGENFEILNHLTRHKHAFQYDTRKPRNRTLVVSEFRDPYQYVLAMIEKPRKAIAHRQMDWKTFVTTQWTTKREESDKKYANSTDPVCQDRYKYAEVVPCEHDNVRPNEYLTNKRLRYNEKEPTREEPMQDIPLYEMKRDGSGEPYASIVDLRAEKIRNHAVEVKDFSFVEDVVIVRYEDLLQEGTAPLHQQISEIVGTKPHCDATPPQKDRPQRQIKEDFKNWMDEHVDWNAEALIGYKKY